MCSRNLLIFPDKDILLDHLCTDRVNICVLTLLELQVMDSLASTLAL